MDFVETIQTLAAKIQQRSEIITNEEMTKNALVLPFLQALGYDPFNPEEIFPEYTADIGTKKGEKVDYAVMKDGNPIMLIECKTCDSNLNQCNAAQLQRYFQVTPSARIGILTDGVQYQFYTDLDRSNLMDEKPFMVFNFKALEESLIPEIKKMSKTQFDIDKTLSAASELKYTRAIKRLLINESQAPSDEFVRHFASKVYSGKLMPAVKEKFAELVKKALQLYINDAINERLKHAMIEEPNEEVGLNYTEQTAKQQVETTDDEREAYYIVKSILRKVVSSERITMRDTLSYCGILLDDNNRKPLCRLHFNTSQYYLGIITDKDKNEKRIPIHTLDEIYEYADELRTTPNFYA